GRVVLTGDPRDPVVPELEPHAPDLAAPDCLGRRHQEALSVLDVDGPDGPRGQLDLPVPSAPGSRVAVDERLRSVAVPEVEVGAAEDEAEARPARVGHLDLAVPEEL